MSDDFEAKVRERLRAEIDRELDDLRRVPEFVPSRRSPLSWRTRGTLLLPLLAAATVAAIAAGIASGAGAFADHQHGVVPATSEAVPQPSTSKTTSAPARPALSGALRAAFSKAGQVDPRTYVPLGRRPGDAAISDVSFASPTGNIGCTINNDANKAVSCVIVAYDFGQPGPDCRYGAQIELDASGYAAFHGCSKVEVNPTDYRVLPYGKAVTDGDMSCVSNTDAITCADLTTNTGFSLSRSAFTALR